MMNWTVTTSLNGLDIHQTTSPDLNSFSANINHSTMTEKDVIVFCGQRGYISSQNASRLTAPTLAGLAVQAQQGLLASAPVMPQQYLPIDTRSLASSNPARAATTAFGFSANEIPQPTEIAPAASYQWTGSMSDLYNAFEGAYNLESIGDQWNTFDIEDPQALDSMIENGMLEDGYLSPFGWSICSSEQKIC